MVRQGMYLRQAQAQKLILTAELRQAMAVLQLPVVELAEFVDHQLQENPLLESAEDGGGGDEFPSPEYGREADWSRFDVTVRAERLAPAEWDDPMEQVADTGGGLVEHLLSQMRLEPLNKRERRIAAYLIGCLDEDGYLMVKTAAAAEKLREPVAVVESVLGLVQSFDPPGVAARDLAECLRLQLMRRGIHSAVLERIVAGHLGDLARGRTAKVALALEVTPEQVLAAMHLLRGLEPRPGRSFSDGGGVSFLIPDVIIQEIGGEYIVLVNERGVPHLTINHTYRRLLGEGDQVTRRFIGERLAAARWLIKNIEQRRLTLLKVCQVLVERQRAFLGRGRAYLAPLTMKEVADRLGYHESTISRTVANKYAQTPQGVFALKFFFSSGLSTATAETVKSAIAELVRCEDPRRPLSDRRIAELLAERNLGVSRRTVAKYRDELGILPAARRKMEG